MQYHECVLECTIPFYPLLFLILGVVESNIEDCLYWQIIDYNTSMLPRPRAGEEVQYINPPLCPPCFFLSFFSGMIFIH